LRLLREKAHFTQGEIANRLGLSISAYNNFEYGYRDMKCSLVKKICELYKCSPHWLLSMDNPSLDGEMKTAYDTLNEKGKKELIQHAGLLSRVPEYNKSCEHNTSEEIT
jgi:transcriptional regulator with XRE-family HTH domain